MLLSAFIVYAIAVNSVSSKIGYFWHITDIQYDPNYIASTDYAQNCKRSAIDPELPVMEQPSLATGVSGGRMGDYSCDSPWTLVESAVKAMKAKHGDNIEFVLWSGDSVSSEVVDPVSRIAAIQNVTNLLIHTFSSQFVFPVLGHDDPGALKDQRIGYTELGNFWRQWLPTDAIQTFNRGGYYTIEQKGNKLRIIALNSNAFSTYQGHHGDDPNVQLEWLEKILNKSVKNKETVYLVSHMCPGSNERDQDEVPSFHDQYSVRYLQMIRKFAAIIVGQFCGHLHSDTFRIVYDREKYKKPISWMMVAPSLSPNKSPGVSNNPGLRLYKFNTNSGHVLDYTQYYIDLETSPSGNPEDWRVEYNWTHYYGLHEISAKSLHNIAQSFQNEDSIQFDRYIEVNSVRKNKPEDCNLECRRAQYCAVTELDYSQFRSCVETGAQALSGSVHPDSAVVSLTAAAAVAVLTGRYLR